MHTPSSEESNAAVECFLRGESLLLYSEMEAAFSYWGF